MKNRGKVLIASSACAVLALVSCGYADSTATEQVSDVGARLVGTVRNTEPGPTAYHFEYGPTTDYGSATPAGSVTVASADAGVAVEADIGGLAEGTTYHYRLCATDLANDQAGSCSPDATFTTTSGKDSVTGTGWVFRSGVSRLAIGSDSLDAHSDADGSNPTGRAGAEGGFFIPGIFHDGPVTCLRVEGNRASIGFVTDAPGNPPVPMVVFVEDNGPSGDRWGRDLVDSPVTSCPTPTEADFGPFDLDGVLIPSTVTSGDFTVHDHPAAP